MTDPVLIENWERFHDSLGTPHPDIKRLKGSYLRDETIYVTLKSVMSHWISEKGSEATVGALFKALKDDRLNWLAGTIYVVQT